MKYLFSIMDFCVPHSLICERTIVPVCFFHNHGGQILEEDAQKGYVVLSLEVFKTHWGTALSSLIKQTCFGQGLDSETPEAPSYLSYSVVLASSQACLVHTPMTVKEGLVFAGKSYF